jgi:hypothetical protein
MKIACYVERATWREPDVLVAHGPPAGSTLAESGTQRASRCQERPGEVDLTRIRE